VKIALLGPDPGALEVMHALLARLNVEVVAMAPPPRAMRQTDRAERLVTQLRDAGFDEVIWLAGMPLHGALAPDPSLEHWLVSDPTALQAVLGRSDPPFPAEPQNWLNDAVRQLTGGRDYSAVIDGVRLAQTLDLTRLAERSKVFRELAARVSPRWATGEQAWRGRGRPAGVGLFKGTGYGLCMEFLYRGTDQEVTRSDLIASLGRSKTPLNRFIAEGVRRGYLRRTTPRGPIVLRNRPRLVDDMVTSLRARTDIRQQAVRSDMPTDRLLVALQQRFSEVGRAFAVTGAYAVRDLGGEHLVNSPVLAFAPFEGLDRVLAQIGATPDPRRPQVILVEPYEAGVFHRQQTEGQHRVSPWQATLDLLSSHSDRERETGEMVRRKLEAM
jgi:hypothetical protein